MGREAGGYHGEMITISNGRILWILNPKTGTRSVVASKLFAGYAENYITGVEHPCFKNLYKVAVVRNPFDRLVSCFFNKVDVGKGYGGKDSGAIPEHVRHSFSAFVHWLAEGDNLRSDVHWLPQSEYLPPAHQIDHLIRFESLRRGFAEVCKVAGQPCELPLDNNSYHDHYSTYFDDELVQVASRLYGEDLQRFGYSFNDMSKARIGWDRYVESMVALGLVPGDEWANRERWESIYNGFLSKQAVKGEVRKFVEIGQGSGKYTLMALADHKPELAICCDVSKRFLDYCEERISKTMPEATVRYELLPPKNRYALMDSVLKHTGPETVDLVFSIDVMVHVEAPLILNYLMNANSLLRLGGTVVMQVANGSTSSGVERMLEDVEPIHGPDEHFEGKFQWVTPSLITRMATRAGLEVELMTCENGVDLYFSATKIMHL